MFKSLFLRSKALTIIAAVVLLVLSAHLFFGRPLSLRWTSPHGIPAIAHGQDQLPCRSLPNADGVVVILRTGATEIQDKLPVHFNTTFRCYNDLIIFSDYEEIFNGFPVHDVLTNVKSSLKDSNADFEIYNRLRKQGRDGLRPDELSGSASFEGSKSGKTDNAGWRLDKWKFLPMMQETLKLRPDKNWYVFLETDSYVVWSNMLQWLKKLDPSKALYYGSENQIGPDIYAHGGSIFVMSRSAVQKAADVYTSREDEWNQLTDKHWAGDCILGKALLEVSVQLTWSWPMFQGGNPEKMDFTEEKGPKKKLWCSPALSYHHFSPAEMQRMWQFEQTWIQSRARQASDGGESPWQNQENDILRHRDIFKKFVLPNITTEWREWNNLSPDMVMTGNDDFDACRHLCEQSPECMQFSVGPPGCSISTKEVMLGQRWKDYRSYWVIDRVDRWMKNLDSCEGYQDWLVT